MLAPRSVCPKECLPQGVLAPRSVCPKECWPKECWPKECWPQEVLAPKEVLAPRSVGRKECWPRVGGFGCRYFMLTSFVLINVVVGFLLEKMVAITL